MINENKIKYYKYSLLQRPEPKPSIKDGAFIVLVFLVLAGIMGHFDKPAIQITSITTSKVQPTPRVIIDDRVFKLEKYLHVHQSPLADYAKYIVSESDANGIDYTMMVSISAIESRYGINTRQDCHNPFGLLNAKGFLCFDTWSDAISYEARLLNQEYRLSIVEGIQTSYCPPASCNPQWSTILVAVSKQILETQ